MLLFSMVEGGGEREECVFLAVVHVRGTREATPIWRAELDWVRDGGRELWGFLKRLAAWGTVVSRCMEWMNGWILAFLRRLGHCSGDVTLVIGYRPYMQLFNVNLGTENATLLREW